jgi:hypothetical protein
MSHFSIALSAFKSLYISHLISHTRLLLSEKFAQAGGGGGQVEGDLLCHGVVYLPRLITHHHVCSLFNTCCCFDLIIMSVLLSFLLLHDSSFSLHSHTQSFFLFYCLHYLNSV